LRLQPTAVRNGVATFAAPAPMSNIGREACLARRREAFR
jgi:hypothetical protein